MRGDLPQRRQRYSDRTRYMVYVLWLYGSTQTAIGAALGLTKGQVAGIVVKSEYNNRAALSLKARADYLAELRSIRRGENGLLIDGGTLPDAVFNPRKI